MIILLGVSGSGKGVQGELLSKKLGCAHWSVGESLRTEASDEIKDYIKTGKFLPDQIIIPFIEKHLFKLNADKAELIMEGSPRSAGQAEWLAQKSNDGTFKLTGVVLLDVDDQESFRRLKLRGREDDSDDSIKLRIQEFHDEINQITDAFSKNGIEVKTINGVGTIEEVAERLQKALNIA